MIKKMEAKLRKKGIGRHPMLKLGSDHKMLWHWIKDNPGHSWADMKDALDVHPQVLSDLRDEGLVITCGRKGPGNIFEIVPENVEGVGRTRIEVEIDVFMNQFGEYSIASKLIDQVSTATNDYPRLVCKKTVKVLVPRPGESHKTRQIFDADVQTFAKPQSSQESDQIKEPLIVDGEYTTVEAQ